MNEQTGRNELKKYEMKQTKEAAEKIKNNILDGTTKIFEHFEMIDTDDSQNLKEELLGNKFFKEEIIDLSNNIAPYIPYIGLTLAGLTVTKYICNKYSNDKRREKYEEKEFKECGKRLSNSWKNNNSNNNEKIRENVKTDTRNNESQK